MDWKPIEEAKVDGLLCDLRVEDSYGVTAARGPYLLRNDGKWVHIKSRVIFKGYPTHFRQTYLLMNKS